MQLIPLPAKLKFDPPPDTVLTKSNPFQQNSACAKDLRHPVNQHIEIAGIRVFQRRHLVQLLHQLIWVDRSLDLNCQFQSRQVGLVPDVADLFELTRLDQVDDPVDDRFARCGRRNLGHLDTSGRCVITIPGTYPHAPAACLINLRQFIRVIQNTAAAWEIGTFEGFGDIRLRVLNQCNCRLADFSQIERTDRTGHGYGNADIGIDQNRREGGRKQRRLGHRIVIVGHHIDGVLVDILKQLRGYFFQLDLGISRRSIGHVPRIGFTEVAL